MKPGVSSTDENKEVLKEYCKKNIAKYALPYDIEFRDQLPKTLVGKVAYRVLEEEEAAKREKNAALSPVSAETDTELENRDSHRGRHTLM